MGINGVNQQNYNYYNRGVNNNFTLNNSYANAPIFTGVNKTNIDSFQNSQAVTPKDGKDDGSIGFWGALKNIGKGVVKFFTNMFTDENGYFSLKQTAKTLGMIGLITAATFIPVIGPLVLPALCTWGMVEGGLNVAKGLTGAMTATTDAEAEQAWQNVGSGATEGALSYVGYKATKGWKGAWKDSTTQYQALKQKYFSEQPSSTVTSMSESFAEEVVEVKPEPEVKPVEKPAMTMTDEARAQYNNTKSLLGNTKHRVSAEAIDEQFATPKELTEMKDYYSELEKTTSINNESVKIERLKNGTKKITEPIKWTTKDGEQLEYTLIREYMPDESIMYRVVDTDQTVVGEWVGFISKSEKGNYIDGYSLWTDRSGRYTKGLGTELKKLIYKDAIEYDCKNIKIKAAWQSHTFHNKMGYKCDITSEYLEPIVATLKLIKLKNTVPEFNKRIEIAINNKNITEINTLVDDILSYANTNGMRSADIGIKDIMIPMKYEW